MRNRKNESKKVTELETLTSQVCIGLRRQFLVEYFFMDLFQGKDVNTTNMMDKYKDDEHCIFTKIVIFSIVLSYKLYFQT